MNPILEDFVHEINQSNQKMNGIKIIQRGELRAEYHWKEEQIQNVHSVAKSFLSTAIGFALEEKVLTLDENLTEYFSEYVNEKNQTDLEKVTGRHLLSMSHGQDASYLMMDQREEMTQTDWVTFSLNQPFTHHPGKHFLYSNVGPYLLGVVLQKRTGQNLVDYLQPRLFEPLEISQVKWTKDPVNNTFAAGGLYLTLTDLVKYGQLYLQKGKWAGQQILSSDWVKQASTPFIETDSEDSFTKYYGYGFWIHPNRRIYRADGAFGQMVMIIPKKEAVITIISEGTETAENMEKIFRLIYPRL